MANNAASDNNRFLLLKFRQKAGLGKPFLCSPSDPNTTRSPTNIKGTFIRPNNLGPIMSPYLIDISPGEACLINKYIELVFRKALLLNNISKYKTKRYLRR